jgi:membrane associated rhomboid family serine protease
MSRSYVYQDSGFGYGIRPPSAIVKWLLIANLGVFVLQSIFFVFKINIFDYVFGLSSSGLSKGFIWQLLTYSFLHGGVLHLFFNLLTLFLFGRDVEDEIGGKRFLTMYLLGAGMGALLWLPFNWSHPSSLLLGASGAICAVLIAFATLAPNRSITLLLFFVFPVTILAKWMAIIFVALEVLFAIRGDQGIAHLAHLGGAAVGYFYIKALFSDHRFNWGGVKSKWKASLKTTSHFKILSPPEKKEDYMEKKIDPILDKIAKQGMQSLTSEERKILDEARERL